MARQVRKRSVRLVERPHKVHPYWTRIVITDAERVEIAPAHGWTYVGRDACGAITIEAGAFEIAAGESRLPEQMHSHCDEECQYILTGRGWIAVEDELHEFEAGDFVFNPAHARHAWYNDGPERVRVLFFRRLKPEQEGRPLDVREYNVQE